MRLSLIMNTFLLLLFAFNTMQAVGFGFKKSCKYGLAEQAL